MADKAPKLDRHGAGFGNWGIFYGFVCYVYSET